MPARKLDKLITSALLDHGPMTQTEILGYVDVPQPSLSRLLAADSSFTATPGPSKLFYVKGASAPTTVEALLRWLNLQAIRLVRLYVHTVMHQGRHEANDQLADAMRQLLDKVRFRLDEIEALAQKAVTE